jgi:uncharacterized protein YraI
MKVTKIKILIPLLVFVMLVSACTPTPVAGPTATVDVNPIYTAAAQTMAAESTMRAALLPTSTPTVEITNTATPEPATATPEVTTAPLVMATELPTQTQAASTGNYAYPVIHSTVNTNCRSGPGIQYDVVGALMPDQKSEVHGISRAGGYWYILNPNKTPKYCWVWSDTTVVDGNINYLPYIEIPATPIAVMPHVGVSVSVSPETAGCGNTFTFSAVITSSEATTITYEWIREDGTTTTPATVVFADDGTQTVTKSYLFKSAMTGWAYMRILSPVTMKSNRAAFTVTCTK